MRLTPPTGRSRLSLVVVLLTTVFPLVGVVGLGWETLPVLVFYWAEFGVVACWSCVEMLFAEKRSVGWLRSLPFSQLTNKRGGRALWAGGPPAYPRNVPHALSMLAGVGVVCLFVGGAILFGSEFDALPLLSLGAGTLGVVVGRGVEFRTEYIGDEEFRETSARMIAATPARQLVALLVLVWVVAPLASARTQGVTAVALVVAGKVAYELYSYRKHHVETEGGRFDDLLDTVFGPRDTALPRDPVEVPEGPPTETVGVDRRTVVVGSVLDGLFTLLSRLYATYGLLAVVAFATYRWGLEGLLVAGAGVTAVFLPALAFARAGHYLLGGTLEFRRYDDVLVSYDRLLDEAQWRLDRSTVTDVSVVRSVTSRVFGSDALRVKALDDEGDQRLLFLGPFSSLDTAANSLDLTTYDPPREPDRTVAVAALGILATFFLPLVAGYATGTVSAAVTVVLALLLLPMLATVLGPLLWTALLNW